MFHRELLCNAPVDLNHERHSSLGTAKREGLAVYLWAMASRNLKSPSGRRSTTRPEAVLPHTDCGNRRWRARPADRVVLFFALSEPSQYKSGCGPLPCPARRAHSGVIRPALGWPDEAKLGPSRQGAISLENGVDNDDRPFCRTLLTLSLRSEAQKHRRETSLLDAQPNPLTFLAH